MMLNAVEFMISTLETKYQFQDATMAAMSLSRHSQERRQTRSEEKKGQDLGERQVDE